MQKVSSLSKIRKIFQQYKEEQSHKIKKSIKKTPAPLKIGSEHASSFDFLSTLLVRAVMLGHLPIEKRKEGGGGNIYVFVLLPKIRLILPCT
jgi:hypothetical protein